MADELACSLCDIDYVINPANNKCTCKFIIVYQEKNLNKFLIEVSEY